VISLRKDASGTLLRQLDRLLVTEIPVDILDRALTVSGQSPFENVLLVVVNRGNCSNCLYSLVIKDVTNKINILVVGVGLPQIRDSGR
jgi:hypothetical protein